MQIIKEKYPALVALCTSCHVAQLYLFGSVITPRFNHASSDLDFLVSLEKLPPLERGEDLIKLWTGLEDIFTRKIDLVTEESLKNPYLRSEIDKTKKLIYDRQSQEIFI